jgi:MFS family permease
VSGFSHGLRASPLRRGPFARLFFGLLVSYIGDQFTTIALLWFVLKLTGSSWSVGATLLAFWLPRALAAPVWGNILDRFAPQRVMWFDNLARTIVITLIPISY